MDYTLLLTQPLALAASCTLALAILSVWITRRPVVWGSLLGITGLLLLFDGRITLMSTIIVVGLWAAIYLHTYSANTWIRLTGTWLTVVLCFVLMLHMNTGIQNWEVVHEFRFNSDSLPYSLYLNFDKPLIGLLFVAISLPLLRTRQEWYHMLKSLIPWIPLTIFTVMIAAYALGYIHWAPKCPAIVGLWAITNLLFTCVTEEAIFRGFLQNLFLHWCRRLPYAHILGIALSSLAFGAAHFAGGYKYVLLATLAGGFYGTVYYRTRSLEASILTHFLLNTTHILLFTYPALAGSI